MEQQIALLEALSDALASVEALCAQRDADSPLVIAPGQLWATSEQLARRYAVSLQWVGDRPRELGAAPISDCSNSKLRYHLGTADAYMEGRIRQPKQRAARQRRAHRQAGEARVGAPLLDFV